MMMRQLTNVIFFREFSVWLMQDSIESCSSPLFLLTNKEFSNHKTKIQHSIKQCRLFCFHQVEANEGFLFTQNGWHLLSFINEV